VLKRIEVEYLDISPDGRLIRKDGSEAAEEPPNPNVQKIRVVYVDAEDGRPGPNFRAYQRRMAAMGQEFRL
jgi:hypothetical protein